MIASMLIVSVCSVTLAADAPTTLDSVKKLFLDNSLVASSTNVIRTIHPADKYPANPVLWPSESWEKPVSVIYGSVLQNQGKFRMWYHNGYGVGYAESGDGISWSKPQLDVLAVDGHKTNTVIVRNATEGANVIPYYYEIFGVHRDDREQDPSRRYKMGFLSIDRNYSGPREDPFHRGQRRGLGVAGSPDGLAWTLIDSWTTDAICDGATHWMWDPALGEYVLYGRTKHIPPAISKAWQDDPWFKYHWGRSVARVQSPDFLRWDFSDPATAPVVMSADTNDLPCTEIYSMLVFPYESVYIGLVQVFHNRADGGFLDIQLAMSHDGVQFERVGDRSPFIPLGPVGSWDRFNHSIANNPPIAIGDELRFYYGGRTYRHSPYQGKDKGKSGGGIGYATIPRGRFVSLGSSFEGGEILTHPLQLAGRHLHLNAKSDYGEIRIEVLDTTGKVIARSRPAREDSLDSVVEWEEGSLAGVQAPVTLRISIDNALLFAIWCTE